MINIEERLKKLGFSVIAHETEDDIMYIFMCADIYIKGSLIVDKTDNKIWKVSLDGRVSDLYQLYKLVEEYNYEKE